MQHPAIGSARVYKICLTRHTHQSPIADGHLARPFIKALINPLNWRGSRLLCWVLLPDRLLMLISLGEMDSVSSLAVRIKAATSHVIDAVDGARRQRWSAHECWPVPAHVDVVAVARDLLREPLRDGLVTRVGDYPYWDAIWLNSRE